MQNMYMKHLYRALGALMVAVFFFQCQKDLSYIGGPDPLPEVIAPDPIAANLQGNILDENNQPAAGVSITVGTATAITNSKGYFRINDAALDKNASLVVAQKAGYFKGYRVFSATSGSNQVVIKLVKKELAGTVSAASGGTATLSNGAAVKLPANGVVTASSGSAYTGDVKVYVAYIDPSATDISRTVPGSFAANNKDGKRVILRSFGMLAVELESDAGEKLQIKTGSVSTLTTPIAPAAAISAPASISLWSVDEQTGLWKEEGTAVKQGNKYVGDVKHFSFWNCDSQSDAIKLSMTIHDPKGLPLVNVPVKITYVDTGGSAYGYTDSLGQVMGLVPANKNLTLEVLDPCSATIYSQDLAPMTTNTDLGIITVTGANSSILTLTGKLVDCSGGAVTKGYAIISYQNFIRYAAVDAGGQFSTTFLTCSGVPASCDILAVDENAQQQGSVVSVAVTAPATNAGNITACGLSSAQFINYTIDGTSYSINSTAGDSLISFANGAATVSTYISGAQKYPGTNNFRMIVNDAASGTFPVNSLTLENFVNTTLVQPFNVTFTSFPAMVGQFYEGSLSGSFTDSTSSTVHSVTSSFKVMRVN